MDKIKNEYRIKITNREDENEEEHLKLSMKKEKRSSKSPEEKMEKMKKMEKSKDDQKHEWIR
jgi:hypothetical protein